MTTDRDHAEQWEKWQLPPPGEATPQQVIDGIRNFKHRYQAGIIVPGYEFAHIVLDDYNLADGHIRRCLDEQADKWTAERIADAKRRLLQWTGTQRGYEQDLQDIQQYRQVATAFLQWLLSVPDETRTEAERLEHGDPE